MPSYFQSTPTCTFKGIYRGSRFGMSLSVAGDLDRDSFFDIVVGASSSNENRGEIVVIYGGHGCPSRHQRVLASIPGTNHMNFGFAVAAVNDLLFSKYSVLFASLPKSQSLAVLKARPVVDLSVDFEILHQDGTILDTLDVIQCVQDQSQGQPCGKIKICLQINWRDEGQRSDDGTVDLYYEIMLDVEMGRNLKRMVFAEHGDSAHSLSVNNHNVRSQKQCIDYSLILKPHILSQVNAVNFSKPLSVYIRVNISKELDDIIMSPVLPEPGEFVSTKMINFTQGCKTGGKCSYDLAITAEGPDGDVIKIYSQSEIVRVKVVIENRADPAFFTKVLVESKTAVITEVSSDCAFLDDDRTTISLKHDVFGSLLLPNHTCHMDIAFSVSPLTRYANDSNMEVNITVFSLLSDNVVAVDQTPENNNVALRRSVVFYSSVTIISSAIPGELQYWRNITNHTSNTFTSLTEEGIFAGENGDITNTYTILNSGPFALQKADLTFTWPALTYIDDLPVLYLYEFSCEPASICTCRREDQCSLVNPWKVPYDEFTNSQDIHLQSQCPNGTNITQNNTNIQFLTPSGYPISKSDLICSHSNGTVKCQVISCQLSKLQSQQNVRITGRFKFWIPTFHIRQENQLVYVGSSVSVNVSRSSVFPDVLHEKSAVTTTYQYFITVRPEPPQPIDFTLILIAIAIGIVLLGIMVLICWKCGYFESRYKLEERRRRGMILSEEERELDQMLWISRNEQSSQSKKQSRKTSLIKRIPDMDTSSLGIDASKEFINATNTASNETLEAKDDLYLEMTPVRRYHEQKNMFDTSVNEMLSTTGRAPETLSPSDIRYHRMTVPVAQQRQSRPLPPLPASENQRPGSVPIRPFTLPRRVPYSPAPTNSQNDVANEMRKRFSAGRTTPEHASERLMSPSALFPEFSFVKNGGDTKTSTFSNSYRASDSTHL